MRFFLDFPSLWKGLSKIELTHLKFCENGSLKLRFLCTLFPIEFWGVETSPPKGVANSSLKYTLKEVLHSESFDVIRNDKVFENEHLVYQQIKEFSN